MNAFPLQTAPPRPEAEIMKDWKNASATVDVCCATFNHVHYIEDALRGFLGQVTTFPFRIIVRDDASSDGTADIVLDYAQRYPNIIRPVIEEQNQYEKGIRPGVAWPSLIDGEYIAICEGDDFWIDPLKLQKQVELLQKHPEAVMSVARTHVYSQEGNLLRYIRTYGASGNTLQQHEDVVKYYYHTSTYLMRSDLLREVIDKYFSGGEIFGDTALRMVLISRGPFVLVPDVVSVYRQTGDGIWTRLDRDTKRKRNFQMAKRLSPLLSGKHRRHQQAIIYGYYKHELVAAARKGRIIEAVRLILPVVYSGMLRVPDYFRRKRLLS